MSATKHLRQQMAKTDKLLNELLKKIKPYELKAKEGTKDYSYAGSIANVNQKLFEINEFLS